jgi:hypothetical protein
MDGCALVNVGVDWHCCWSDSEVMRRFLRWLFRAEIALEVEAMLEWHKLNIACAAKLQRDAVLAQGMMEGMQAAFDGIDRAMRERQGVSWEPQDVASAKRRLLH